MTWKRASDRGSVSSAGFDHEPDIRRLKCRDAGGPVVGLPVSKLPWPGVPSHLTRRSRQIRDSTRPEGRPPQKVFQVRPCPEWYLPLSTSFSLQQQDHSPSTTHLPALHCHILSTFRERLSLSCIATHCALFSQEVAVNLLLFAPAVEGSASPPRHAGSPSSNIARWMGLPCNLSNHHTSRETATR